MKLLVLIKNSSTILEKYFNQKSECVSISYIFFFLNFQISYN